MARRALRRNVTEKPLVLRSTLSCVKRTVWWFSPPHDFLSFRPLFLSSSVPRQLRLLHREVNLLLQGVDRQGTLYGAVLHPKGDLRHELLKDGLARMVDWSLVYVPRGDALAKRQAENEGKRARRRLWSDWSPPKIDGDANFDAVVVEVHSGDQLSVALPGGTGSSSGGERRLTLSSVRAPRMGNPRPNVDDEPWAFESKDMLRKLAIGKSVRVVVDYQREIPQTSGEGPPVKRAFATVTVVGAGEKSLQEAIVEAGMAAVARLRQDDPRSVSIWFGSPKRSCDVYVSKKRLLPSTLLYPCRTIHIYIHIFYETITKLILSCPLSVSHPVLRLLLTSFPPPPRERAQPPRPPTV